MRRILFLLCMISAPGVRAQVAYTWLGGAGDWETASNWTPVGVPGRGDTAIITRGRVTLSTSVELADLRLSGGVLTGRGNLTVTRSGAWTGGELSGDGVLELAARSAFTLSGNTAKINRGRPIRIGGAADWTDGDIRNGDGSRWTVLRGGVFRCTANTHTMTDDLGGAASQFINQGSLECDVPGTVRVEPGLFSSGTLRLVAGEAIFRGSLIQTGGATELAGGSLRPVTLDLRAGALTGGGSITGAVINGGQCSPGTGPGDVDTITITGALSQTTNGGLEIDLLGAGAGQFDKIEVSGAVDLDGDLLVRFNLAGPLPDSETVGVITGSPVTGPFSGITVSDTSYLVQVQYPGNAAELHIQSLLKAFNGGDGDGHDANRFSGFLDGQSAAVLDIAFDGGDGDGHDADRFSGFLDGQSTAALDLAFNGGDGDGHDANRFSGFLDGQSSAVLDLAFNGGDGDGHDANRFSGFLDGQSSAVLDLAFGGGDGDGHDTQEIRSKMIEDSFDVDRDRIADYWENDHGLDPANPADATTDVDRDGVDARGEYVADTDPNDRGSVFRLQIRPGIELEFPASQHRLYQVESRPDLRAGDWAPQGREEPGRGGPKVIRVGGAAVGGQFRVRVRVPAF